MRRLSVRLLLSHLLVAVLAGAATYLVVRLLAPLLFEGALRAGGGPGGGLGAGPGSSPGGGPVLRQQFADAVENALLIGTLVGVGAATLFGMLASRRLLRPLAEVRQVTREIANGRYDVRVPTGPDTEVAALAADVNSLATSLADTEARRVRLLGEVAHELRTPLTVIDGSVEGMIDGVLPADAEHLGVLTQEVRRLRRLADDLSTLSRAEEGRLSVVPTRISLRAVLADAVARLGPQAADAGLTLTLTPSEDVSADADPDRLAQVVTNVVGNALRATPPGGSVSVSLTRAGSIATIAVADTGEGLSASDLERIFERFYRVAGRRGSEGSGIGLTIARRIMHAHGGDLTAQSEGPGRGSTFLATLPVG